MATIFTSDTDWLRQGRKSKYRSKKTEMDGICFDSKKEAERYAVLKLLEKAGEIHNLKLQPRFTLQEGFRDRNQTPVRPITYVADFQYETKSAQLVVEDTKGVRTEVYKLKKKLFLKKYPDIDFREI